MLRQLVNTPQGQEVVARKEAWDWLCLPAQAWTPWSEIPPDGVEGREEVCRLTASAARPLSHGTYSYLHTTNGSLNPWGSRPAQVLPNGSQVESTWATPPQNPCMMGRPELGSMYHKDWPTEHVKLWVALPSSWGHTLLGSPPWGKRAGYK